MPTEGVFEKRKPYPVAAAWPIVGRAVMNED